MTQPNIITLAPQTISRLVILQSVLTGLQTVVAATVLGDVVGAKLAALLIVVVSGGQQAVNSVLSKSVASHVDTMQTHVATAIEQAESAAAHSEDAANAAEAASARVLNSLGKRGT